jgi:hypothetical protein
MSQAFSLTCAWGLKTEVAETRSGEAGALNDYFPHRVQTGTNLDLVLGAEAAAEQTKTHGQSSKNAGEGVSKP